MLLKLVVALNNIPPKQNRQNRHGNILQYIGKFNSNRANYVNYVLLVSLYILTDIGLFFGTLWHVHAMVFNMSSFFLQLVCSLLPCVFEHFAGGRAGETGGRYGQYGQYGRYGRAGGRALHYIIQ